MLLNYLEVKISSKNINSDARVHIESGCQFIAMNFSNKDANLEYYRNFFKDGNYLLDINIHLNLFYLLNLIFFYHL